MTNLTIKPILENLIDAFYLSERVGGELAFSESPLPVSDALSGELRTYYQHLQIEEEAFFGNGLCNLVLLPPDAEGNRPETWALQDYEPFAQGDYVIFACTVIDDILYCDTRDEKCPVFGLISGSLEPYPLADSLYQFLDFYSQLTRIEAQAFAKDIYLENFVPKPAFIQQVEALIDQQVSSQVRAGLRAFMLE